MAKKKKAAKPKPENPPKNEPIVRTNLTFEQLLNLAANTPIKKKEKK